MPTGGVAQGNTTNASDCNVFYNGLKTRYGASNVYTAGFTVGSDTVNMSSIASVTTFEQQKTSMFFIGVHTEIHIPSSIMEALRNLKAVRSLMSIGVIL